MSDKMDELAASRREEVFSENLYARFNEWVPIYTRRYSSGDWPDPLNAAQADTVLALLYEANASIPFTPDRFNAHSARISADITAWRDTVKQEIVDNLAEVYGMPRDTASLSRAAAVIHCSECAQVLFASNVMHHLQVCGSERVMWDERHWGYDAALHRIARSLLHHAGLACDVGREHVDWLEGVLRCGCTNMKAPRGFLALVREFCYGVGLPLLPVGCFVVLGHASMASGLVMRRDVQITQVRLSLLYLLE